MSQTLTTTEAAAVLNVTPRRVVAMIRSGKLRATMHGRDWMIDAADLATVRHRPPGRPRVK
jgi:excisionase family DNA binding protein